MENTPSQDFNAHNDKEEDYSYKIVKTIDNPYGKLFIVLCDLNKSGQKKQYFLKKLMIERKEEKEILIEEIEKIKTLKCKYVVNICDYFIEEKEQKEYLCILMEYFENDNLEELIKKEKFLNSRNIWRIFIQLIIGLNSIHSKDIIIKDLNPKNIFLDEENNIKIFLSLNYSINKTKDFSLMLYDSPEIINGGNYNEKSDIWSLGCILYELITKKKPFYFLENVLNIKYDKGQIFDDDFRNLISKILCKERKRILLNQLLREKVLCEKIIEENLFDEYLEIKNYFFINSSELFSKINTFKLDELNSSPFFLSCKNCHKNPLVYLKNEEFVMLECIHCSIKKDEKISNLFNYSSEWITNNYKYIENNVYNYDDKFYYDILNINLFKTFLENAKKVEKNKYNFAYHVTYCLQYRISNDPQIKKIANETISEIIKIFFKDLKIIQNLIFLSKLIFSTFKLSSNKNILEEKYKKIINEINAIFNKEKIEEYQNSISLMKNEFERLSKKIINERLYEKNQEKKLKVMKKELLQRQKKIREEIKSKNENEDNDNLDDEKIINEKMNLFLEDMCIYSNIIEKEIIKEKEENPEKFIETNEALNLEQEDPDLFALGLLSKNFENDGLETVIEREEQADEDESGVTSLQFLASGLYKKKRYNLHFDLGEERNEELLVNEKEYEKFKANLKLKLSKDYNIPVDKIIVTFPQKGSFHVQVIFQSDEFENLDEQSFYNKFKNDPEFDELKNLKEIHADTIFHIAKMNKNMLDKRGNRESGWGVNEKRGNKPYYPPIDWKGIGLKAMDKYDNGNNTWLGFDGSKGEWCVAYHGVGRASNSQQIKQIIGSIYNGSFKPGQWQAYKDDEDLFHKGKKVKTGVYCTPKIDVAEGYAGQVDINNKKYYAVLMVRVKPKAIRCPKTMDSYWIVNGATDEIRPYRILYKEVTKK